MLVLRELDQECARERPLHQVEGALCERTASASRLVLAILRRYPAHVDLLDRHGPSFRHDLHRTPVRVPEVRAEDLMPHGERIECAMERLDIEISANAVSLGEMMHARAGRELFEEPYPFLPRRHWHHQFGSRQRSKVEDPTKGQRSDEPSWISRLR